jgi:hypothetical protein
MRAPDRWAKVERPATDLSVRRQCELLNVALHLELPFFGS